MEIKHIKLFAVVMLSGLVIAGCKKKDDDGNDDEEENITTVKVTLTPVTGGSAQTYTWKDVDGPGGNAPVIDQITLLPSIPYNCSIQFLDESKTPAEDKTSEIVSEANDHQIYYAATGVLVNVGNLNNDGNALPLGTTSIWTNTGLSNGSMKITLKHKPGQKASGDPVTKGETDVEVTFPTRVQ
jgi:hypothetical protein